MSLWGSKLGADVAWGCRVQCADVAWQQWSQLVHKAIRQLEGAAREQYLSIPDGEQLQYLVLACLDLLCRPLAGAWVREASYQSSLRTTSQSAIADWRVSEVSNVTAATLQQAFLGRYIPIASSSRTDCSRDAYIPPHVLCSSFANRSPESALESILLAGSPVHVR